MNNAIRNGVEECMSAAGIKENAPVAKSNKPRMMPFLYPYFFMKIPAGIAMSRIVLIPILLLSW